VFWPLTALLEQELGWRGALLAIAAANAACALLHAAFLPGPVPRAIAGPGTSLDQALRLPAFWLLAGALTLAGFAFGAIAAHVVPAMTEAGFATAALWLAPLIGVSQTLGRIVEFSLGGRIPLRRVGLAALAAYPVAFLLLAWGQAVWIMLAFVVLYGVSNGLQTIVRGALPAEMFGRAAYGAISGALATPAALAKAAGPIGLGLLWQATGGYAWPLTVLAAMGLAACLMFAAALRAAPRITVSTIRSD
jgi:predicted MFS family arabinose efflux permease